MLKQAEWLPCFERTSLLAAPPQCNADYASIFGIVTRKEARLLYGALNGDRPHTLKNNGQSGTRLALLMPCGRSSAAMTLQQ